MTDFATGGNMGRGILFYLASNYPEEVLGLYLTDVGAATSIVTSPDEKLSPDELAYKRTFTEWMRRDGAYINIQGSKPYLARFPHDILPVPKEWIEQNYNLAHYTDMPFGGHFTAMEAPEAFAADLKVFIDKLLGNS